MQHERSPITELTHKNATTAAPVPYPPIKDQFVILGFWALTKWAAAFAYDASDITPSAADAAESAARAAKKETT